MTTNELTANARAFITAIRTEIAQRVEKRALTTIDDRTAADATHLAHLRFTGSELVIESVGLWTEIAAAREAAQSEWTAPIGTVTFSDDAIQWVGDHISRNEWLVQKQLAKPKTSGGRR